jgi:TrmH family RNA methyltransferase
MVESGDCHLAARRIKDRACYSFSHMTKQEPIRSRANALYRQVHALKTRNRADGLMLLEGIKLIEEALAAGIALVHALISPRLERSQRGRALLDALAGRGVEPRLLDDALLSSISQVETSQGALALARRPAFTEADLYRGRPLILVVTAVQDPGNVGALLRAAEGAGATGAYLAASSADPYSWKALRGGMGSAFRLPCVRMAGAEQILTHLRSRQVVSVAAVASGGLPYDRVDMRRPLALWLGNEGAGLPDALVGQLDERVTVPLAPPVESLNVAVAGGLLLFEADRQRRAGG